MVGYGFNRGGVWTVSEGAFQPFGGRFPDSNIFDQFLFAADGATGRIIGLNAQAEPFAADPGTRVFRSLASPYPGGKSVVFAALAYLPHRRATMFGYGSKVYRLDGEEFVLVTDTLPFPFTFGARIDDLPKLGAMLVTAGYGGGMAIVYDDGAIEVVQAPVPGSEFRIADADIDFRRGLTRGFGYFRRSYRADGAWRETRVS
jgi:hypothetical protein